MFVISRSHLGVGALKSINIVCSCHIVRLCCWWFIKFSLQYVFMFIVVALVVFVYLKLICMSFRNYLLVLVLVYLYKIIFYVVDHISLILLYYEIRALLISFEEGRLCVNNSLPIWRQYSSLVGSYVWHVTVSFSFWKLLRWKCLTTLFSPVNYLEDYLCILFVVLHVKSIRVLRTLYLHFPLGHGGPILFLSESANYKIDG